MKKNFYSHLIDTESLVIELDKMGFSEEERGHLVALIDSNVHHTVLELILSELAKEDKKVFLEHVAGENHEKVWELLNQKVDKIEEKITKAASDLKVELHKDIKESKDEE
jgi:hypothetical protein